VFPIPFPGSTRRPGNVFQIHETLNNRNFSEINEAMKIACADALAKLAKEPVPESVKAAFPAEKSFEFGREYLVPTPFDPRLLTVISTAAAKAACESGVARSPISDWAAYEKRLQSM
jgi:malate dehydrogenase (oxaloacetate-decarboxylating)(NADP+)